MCGVAKVPEPKQSKKRKLWLPTPRFTLLLKSHPHTQNLAHLFIGCSRMKAYTQNEARKARKYMDLSAL